MCPDFKPPAAVSELGELWPPIHAADWHHLVETLADRVRYNLSHRPRAALVYAQDELAKIQRLIEINQDYRSAFIRAHALDQVLLNVRLATLFTQSMFETRDGQTLATLAQTLGNVQPTNVVSSISRMRDLRDALTESDFTLRPVQLWVAQNNQTQEHRFKFRQRADARRMNQFWKRCTLVDHLEPDQFDHIRNNLAHAHRSVDNRLARAALEFVLANFQDAMEHWLEDFGVTYAEVFREDAHLDKMPWRDLMRMLKLDHVTQ
jgi:hypothetical protein